MKTAVANKQWEFVLGMTQEKIRGEGRRRGGEREEKMEEEGNGNLFLVWHRKK
jgi:hypothetical protein